LRLQEDVDRSQLGGVGGGVVGGHPCHLTFLAIPHIVPDQTTISHPYQSPGDRCG
jgi:hypothetical protein